MISNNYQPQHPCLKPPVTESCAGKACCLAWLVGVIKAGSNDIRQAIERIDFERLSYPLPGLLQNGTAIWSEIPILN